MLNREVGEKLLHRLSTDDVFSVMSDGDCGVRDGEQFLVRVALNRASSSVEARASTIGSHYDVRFGRAV